MTNSYDNGKIYKLICDDDHYYIGSTTQKLNHRFNNHKTSAKTGTSKAYTYINSIGWDKVKIELRNLNKKLEKINFYNDISLENFVFKYNSDLIDKINY